VPFTVTGNEPGGVEPIVPIVRELVKPTDGPGRGVGGPKEHEAPDGRGPHASATGGGEPELKEKVVVMLFDPEVPVTTVMPPELVREKSEPVTVT
jgi:hypothetical protein